MKGKRLNVLVVVPKNGLANRMRAIEAGAAMAEEHGIRFAVDWWREPDCDANFDELFEAPSFDVRNRRLPSGRLSRLRKSVVRGTYKAQGYLWVDDEDVLWWDHQKGRESSPLMRRIFSGEHSLPLGVKRLVLHTHRVFYKSLGNWRHLEPRRELVAEAKLLLSQAAGADGYVPWIGVHIRRGDHSYSRHQSPTELFISAVEERLARWPNARIFVATDSPDEAERLSQQFSDRVSRIDKVHWGRSGQDAMRSAMLDLICLSYCTVILGSYWSSFSYAAARLRGCELEVIRAVEEGSRAAREKFG